MLPSGRYYPFVIDTQCGMLQLFAILECSLPANLFPDLACRELTSNNSQAMQMTFVLSAVNGLVGLQESFPRDAGLCADNHKCVATHQPLFLFKSRAGSC